VNDLFSKIEENCQPKKQVARFPLSPTFCLYETYSYISSSYFLHSFISLDHNRSTQR